MAFVSWLTLKWRFVLFCDFFKVLSEIKFLVRERAVTKDSHLFAFILTWIVLVQYWDLGRTEGRHSKYCLLKRKFRYPQSAVW